MCSVCRDIISYVCGEIVNTKLYFSVIYSCFTLHVFTACFMLYRVCYKLKNFSQSM